MWTDTDYSTAVFDDEHSSISRMYRDLECQHHLVQEHFDERPDIPGLTPVGFQRWMTLLIQAHPNEEFERLQKAVLAMPINNPDDKKERFPKELSRRLFPGSGDGQVCERIEKAITLHANVDLQKRSKNRELSPKPASHKSSVAEAPYAPSSTSRKESNVNGDNAPPPYAPSNIERERKPYASIPTESAIDDTNPAPRRRLRLSPSKGNGSRTVPCREAASSSKKARNLDQTRQRQEPGDRNQLHELVQSLWVSLSRTLGVQQTCRSLKSIIITALRATLGAIEVRHSATTIDVRTGICAGIHLPSSLALYLLGRVSTMMVDGMREIEQTEHEDWLMKMRVPTARVQPGGGVTTGGWTLMGHRRTVEATSATMRKIIIARMGAMVGMGMTTSSHTAVRCTDELAG